jgi:hypothetical protein
MALTEDRATAHKGVDVVAVPLAADAVAFAGGIAAVNAAGYGVVGSDTAGLVVAGRFEESGDNTGGSAGDMAVRVRRGKAFYFKNSTASPVLQASLFSNVVIEDDETVATDTTNDIVAGVCVGLDSGGVWVYIG